MQAEKKPTKHPSKIRTFPIGPEEAFDIWLSLPGPDKSHPRAEMRTLAKVLEKRANEIIKARDPKARAVTLPTGILYRWRSEYQWDRRVFELDMKVSDRADAIVGETLAEEIANRRLATRRLVGDALDNVARAAATSARKVAEQIDARVKAGKTISPDDLKTLTTVLDKMERIHARTPVPAPSLPQLGEDADGNPITGGEDFIALVYSGRATSKMLMQQLAHLDKKRNIKAIIDRSQGKVIDGEAHEITPE